MSSQIPSVYGSFVVLLLIEMATPFSLRTHLNAFLQRLFQNVHYVTYCFWEEAKSIFCILVTAEWSQRNDCRKCFWWISFAGLPSDRVLVLAWNPMRERQVQGNDKHSIDCPPHGTSLHGLDDVAPLPTPVTSFYLTQRQWPVWLGSSTCSLSISWVNEMEK